MYILYSLGICVPHGTSSCIWKFLVYMPSLIQGFFCIYRRMEQICIYHGFSLYIPFVSGYLYIRYCFLRISVSPMRRCTYKPHNITLLVLHTRHNRWWPKNGCGVLLAASYPSAAGKANIAAFVWIQETWGTTQHWRRYV